MSLDFDCRWDKMKQKKEKNWASKHHRWIQKWYAKVAEIENMNAVRPAEVPHDGAAFSRYVSWLGRVSRLYLQSLAFEAADIEEEEPAFDQLAQLEYNRLVHDGRGPQSAGVVRFVVSFVLLILLTRS